MDMNNMKAHNHKMSAFILFLVVICMSVLSCGKEKQTDEIGPTGLNESPSTISPTMSPISEEPWDHASQTIRWVLKFSPSISEEDRKTVNRILYEKGIDCKIEFVTIPDFITGQEYVDWVTTEADADILTVNTWYDAIQGLDFSEEYFLPLEEYLETEEGEALRNAFADVEWGGVTNGGKTFTIPRRWKIPTHEVHLAYDNDYAEYFTLFDGTYASLKNIYEKIGNPNLRIAFYDLSLQELDALLGYRLVYLSAVPYSDETKQAIPAERVLEEEGRLFEAVYEDLKNGILSDLNYDNPEYENVLAYIYEGIQEDPAGYTSMMLSEATYEFNNMGCYGVYCESKQKELALEVLTACFEDSRIASVLLWGDMDPEKWDKFSILLNEAKPDNLTGFLPTLTAEEKGYLSSYETRRIELLGGMFYRNANGQRKIIQNYKADGVLRSNNQFEFGIEAINRELDVWFSVGQEGQ